MFRFALYESDSSFSKKNSIGEAPNNTDGSFSFSEITYGSEGKHFYIVKEVTDNPIKNIKYDKSEYHVTVEVKDDKEGNYYTNVSITSTNDGTEKTVDKISFNNSYSGPDDADKDKGEKKKSVKTGDESMLIAWIAMLLLSSGGLITIIVMSGRRTRRS